MKILKFLDKHFENIFIALLFTATIVLVAVQILTRYVFKSINIPWTEEIARYCYVFMIYIGASYCVKQDTHLRVDILKGFLSAKHQKIQRILTEVLCCGFYVCLFPFALKVVQMHIKNGKTLPVSDLPAVIFTICTPIMLILLLVRTVQAIIKTIQELKEMRKEDELS